VPNSESEGEIVYTTTEIAQRLRVSEESVRREIRRGQLQAMQIGRLYRATSGDLIAWLGEVRYNQLFADKPTNAPRPKKPAKPSKTHSTVRRGRA
jgi:excisionase family DNA binding protein